MNWRLRPWVRRMLSRMLAIVPAVWFVFVRGEGSITELVNLSQVVLCLILPMASLPLLWFTSSKKVMGPWGNRGLLLVLGWGIVLLITAIDVYSLPESLRTAWQILAG